MLVLSWPFTFRIVLPDESRNLIVGREQLQLSVAEVLHQHDILLNTRCGQQGICAGCEVELIDGTVMDLDTGRPLNAGRAPVCFRACQSQLSPAGDVAICVPARSLAVHEPVATAEFCIRVPFSHEPLFDGQFAAAIDVGTTSVTVAIIDLDDGAILAAKSAPNAQSRWGQDVLSRIACLPADRRAVAAMQEAICAKPFDRSSISAWMHVGGKPRLSRCDRCRQHRHAAPSRGRRSHVARAVPPSTPYSLATA